MGRLRVRFGLAGVFVGMVLAAAACGEGGGPGTGTPPGTGPDVKQAGALSLDERDVTAVLAGDRLDVSLVLRNAGSTPIAVKASVRVVAIGDDSFSRQAEGDFTVGPDSETLSLPVPTFPEAGDATKQAGYVLYYRVRSDQGTIGGFRSLFVAVPKTQVVLLGPKTYYDGEQTRVKVLARDPVTGRPIADREVVVKVVMGEDVREIPVRTDGFGAASVALTLSGQGEAHVMALMATDAGTTDKAEQEVDVVRLRKVYLGTDKPLYQPGQQIHIRVLALKKPSLAPEAASDAVIEVFDGKGNKVFKKAAKTSAFGIASTTFRIATEVNTGTWKLKATVGDTVTEKAVTVDRYVLPKFKVDLSLDRTFYTVGQTIRGTVSAQYFFGKPVAGGQVRIGLDAFDVEFAEFASVTGTTKPDGLFAFETKLPDHMVGQSLEQGKAIVRVRTEVTDTAGQVVKKESGLAVAADAFDVVVIPEGGTIVPGVANGFYVFAEDPAGGPVAAAVEVTAGGETRQVATDATGIGQFAVMPEGATLAVAVKAIAQGTTVEKSFEFKAGQSGEALLVRPDKAIYKVGDTAVVTMLVPDARDRVYLDVIRRGQVAREEALDVEGGKAVAEIDLDEGLAGDVVFSAYYMGRLGTIVRDERLGFVQAADALAIAVTPDRKVYAPGEPAKVEFRVTGPNEVPVAAALGIHVVDEAVYALSENKPGLLKAYFELEKAITEPKYEIHAAHFDLSSIVTDQPADEEGKQAQEALAGAAFAALGDPKLTDAASSWEQALAATVILLGPHYLADKQRVMDAIAAMLSDGDLTYDGIVAWLVGEARFYDFWGNLYVFESMDQYTVTMRSAGPDEILGTGDDWSATGSYWEFTRNGWDDQANFDGGPFPGGPPQAGAGGDPSPTEKGGSGGGGEPKIRKDFPETLYVNPELITDENGRAIAEFQMADSITEWRLSAVGNTASGRIGTATKGLTAFMPFFVDVDVPRTLRRGDEVHFPVAVYNYLPEAQVVQVEVEAGAWAELTSSSTFAVPLGPSEVKGVNVGLKAGVVGWHGVTVKAYGNGDTSDAVMRLIEVTPDGVEVRGAESGKLAGPVTKTVSFPVTAIPGTPKVIVKVYPGVMAQAVEGLDSLLQMPSGCFEQTTATLWPNLLVLDYMQTSGQLNPEIELKAREFVSLGYQRLLTFECTGGGFTWFGDPAPANIILTGMGVMEFTDMAKVQEIDETLVPRTIDFLAAKQAADGSWHETQGSEFATVQYDDLMTTCFVTWALAQAKGNGLGPAGSGFGYAKAHLTDAASTYALALCANALAAYAPNDPATVKALNDLAARAKEDGDKVYWESGVSGGQMYYGEADGMGGGGSAPGSSIEATALAVMALLEAKHSPDLVSKALAWMVSNKDSFGNWGTTHATILSLRAFVKSLSALAQEAAGTVKVAINGKAEEDLAIDASNQDVFFQFELADKVDPVGENVVNVTFQGKGTLMYQIVWSHYEPGAASGPAAGPLEIDVAYDKTTLAVDDVVKVTATVTNVSGDPAPMVLVDLGLPPGFDLLTDDLDAAVAAQKIQKYELTARQITVYVDAILPNEALVLTYALRAKYPLSVTAPDSGASLYYDPDSKDSEPGAEFEVQ